MKNIIIVLICLWPLTLYSQERSITSINSEWFFSNRELINQEIKSGSDFSVIPIINTICTIWKYRDGAIGKEVSPSIANAIIFKPTIIYSWFDKNKEDFNAWVSDIPYTLFTDYRGDQEKELENLRLEMIAAIQLHTSRDGKSQHKIMANRLMDVLKKTSIRKID